MLREPTGMILEIHLGSEHIAALDLWIAMQADEPDRSEAVRRILTRTIIRDD
jgi:hypothetical protein